MKTPRTIEKRLALAMKERKVNRSDLAYKLDVHRTLVGLWLNGKRDISPKYYFEISNILNISVYWLAHGVGSMHTPSIIKNQFENKIITMIRGLDDDLRKSFLIILEKVSPV